VGHETARDTGTVGRVLTESRRSDRFRFELIFFVLHVANSKLDRELNSLVLGMKCLREMPSS
jgi:hypothetical protein